MWYEFLVMADWSAGWSDVWTALRRSKKLSTCIIYWGQTYRTGWRPGIRKENCANQHQVMDILLNCDKCSYCALSVNLTCIHIHDLFRDKFSSLYANWTYVTGNTYWRSWSLFSSNQWNAECMNSCSIM